MYCPQCGKQQLLAGAHFCYNCGFALSEVRQLVHQTINTMEITMPNEQHQTEGGDTITFPVPTSIEEMEKGMILATLNKTKDNKTRTAELLKISLKTLHNKLALYRRQ